MNTLLKIFSLFFILSAVSCEDVIEVKLNDEIGIVTIEASIETNSNPQVLIGKTRAYNDQTPPTYFSNAEVFITDNSVPPHRIQLFQGADDMHYTSQEQYFGQVGKVYTLTVNYEGTTYTAKDSLRAVSAIDSVFVKKNNKFAEYFSIMIDSQETVGLGDCYRWIVYVNDEPLLQHGLLAVTDDERVEGNYIKDLQIFSGGYAANFFNVELNEGDVVKVKQMSISRNVLTFYERLQTLAGGQGLFSPPPANVTTSFDNGAIGIFRASDVSTSYEVVVPPLSK